MACNCSDSDCSCESIACPEPSQGATGQQGETGATGAAGTNGVNSFSEVSVAGVVPAVNTNVVLSLDTAVWVIDGQNLYLDGIGYYEVISHTPTTVTVENLGAPGNAAPAAVIPIGTAIGPAGYEGPELLAPLPIADGGTGQATAIAAFNGLSPLTVNGDLLARLAGSNTRIAVGTNGQVLLVTGGLPAWGTNAPVATNITGILPIANGGTNANSAATARTNLNAAALTGGNAFDGNQSFSVDEFLVAASGTNLIDIQNAGSIWIIEDWTGADSVDIQNRRLFGLWSQTAQAYTTASAATFSAWTNVETVVSTYSLTGAQAITLPAGTDGRVVTVKDGSRNASVNPITITRSGADTIEGSTTYVINNDGGVVKLMFFAATTDWKVM